MAKPSDTTPILAIHNTIYLRPSPHMQSLNAHPSLLPPSLFYFYALTPSACVMNERDRESHQRPGVEKVTRQSPLHQIRLRMVFIKPEQDPPQRSSWPRVLRLPPNWYCLVVNLNKVKQFSPSPPPEEVNEERKRVVIAEKKKLVSTCLF
ncbi:hypothetical protein SESBI_18714 [Sesbania bispinosa]|nr:hypothetical protein SESBI_18714 [Sesbania bispinosa]